MSELRFDGRVAVVTGAGRGLGRAHAMLLAARGAAVVVNDLGGSVAGTGADTGPASAVVREIGAAGGTAVPDVNDVASPEGAEALIATAVDTFGRIDVLITNAGIVRWAGFPDADEENLARHLAVHVGGTFHTARAAWGHMTDAGYGRIVMTTSTGMLGLATNLSYAAAKGGVFGLGRSLATAGAPAGIKVNLVAPAAMTRMARRPGEAEAADADAEDPMSPHLVAPLVAYLAHESCPVTGELYAAGAGRFARMFLACAPGYVHGGGGDAGEPGDGPSIEDVAGHWAAINDDAGYTVPADLQEWSSSFLAHLPPDGRGRR